MCYMSPWLRLHFCSLSGRLSSWWARSLASLPATGSLMNRAGGGSFRAFITKAPGAGNEPNAIVQHCQTSPRHWVGRKAGSIPGLYALWLTATILTVPFLCHTQAVAPRILSSVFSVLSCIPGGCLAGFPGSQVSWPRLGLARGRLGQEITGGGREARMHTLLSASAGIPQSSSVSFLTPAPARQSALS